MEGGLPCLVAGATVVSDVASSICVASAGVLEGDGGGGEDWEEDLLEGVVFGLGEEGAVVMVSVEGEFGVGEEVAMAIVSSEILMEGRLFSWRIRG